MTLSVSTQVSPVGTKLTRQTDADENANNDVTNTSGTIYQVQIDNTGNADNAAYLKIYDDAAPTVGTTAPDFIFKAPISQTRDYVIPLGGDFTTALSFACVISGGTAGTTGPTSAVTVRIVSS
jgi:hypothetical protein